jgi:hypothetical protein
MTRQRVKKVKARARKFRHDFLHPAALLSKIGVFGPNPD